MFLNLLLLLGVLAIIASWIVAVRLVQSDKFSGPVAGKTPAESIRRNDVLVSSAH